MDWVIAWHHVGPVFGVVIGIDGSQNGMMHVAVLVITGEVNEIELHGFTVRRL